MARPVSGPLAEQTQYSPRLLDLFESIVLPSPGYEQRLKNHYQMFRAAVEQEGAGRTRTQRSPARRSSRSDVAKKFPALPEVPSSPGCPDAPVGKL